MNRFYDSVISPRVDRVVAPSGLHTPPRDEVRPTKRGFPQRLLSELAPSAVVQVVLQTVLTEGLAETALSETAALATDQQPLLDEGLDRAQRIANGRVDADDVAWLSKGFSAFLAAGGALTLERCLGLPRNDCALRRACRDYWLRKAWKALSEDLSPWRRSEKLAAAVRDFQSRQWLRWRMLKEPPAFASDLEGALFQAFRSAERVPQTAMQLHNIANHRRHS